MYQGVIHYVRTKKEKGVMQKRTPCVQGGGLHMEVRTQKRPFLHVFCDIFICWKLLPYFFVFGVDFHYCFIKHLLRLFTCLSNVFQSISLWNYLLDI